MKKIYFVIFIFALSVCGCDVETPTGAGMPEKMVKVQLYAANAVSDTRTVLNDDFSVSWNHGDEVFLVSTGQTQGMKLANILEDGPEGLFEGEVLESMFSNDRRETVLYPVKAEEWSAAKGKTMASDDWGQGIREIVLPDVQPMISGTFARDYNFAAASFELSDRSLPLYFHNLCGLLRVNLRGNATIRSIAITSPAKMNGVFRINSGGAVGEEVDFLVALTEAGSSETVTLVSEEGLALSDEPQKFYACVLPETAKVGSTLDAGPGPGDYIVAVTTVEGKVVTKTVALAEGVSASMISDLGELEVNYTYADLDGSVIDLDPSGKDAVVFDYLGDAPVVSSKPEWLDVTISDGTIGFRAEMQFGGSERSGDVVIVGGDTAVTITVRQTSVPALELQSVHFGGAADSRDVAKTEYLTMEYTVDDSEYDWITAIPTSAGIRISVTKNETGARRDGSVDVKVGDVVVGSVAVVQMPVYEYSTFIGEYSIDFKQNSGNEYKASRKMTVAALEEGVSYKVTFKNAFEYTMTMTYTPDGPGIMSLICPQHTGTNTVGNAFESQVHVAKKHSNGNFKITKDNYTEIDVTDEGCGYDLVINDSDGCINLDFIPNALTQELYPEGLSGIWFPFDYTKIENDTPVDGLKDWLRPLDGQEYLRITKK